MKLVTKLGLGAALAIGVLSAGVTSASAAIVCNGEGACWHVKRSYHYQPGWGVVVHPNNWRWGPNDHYAWREHRGRGYWRNGAWVRF